MLKRFDQQIYKYNPDQMVLRLNQLVDLVNKLEATIAKLEADKEAEVV